MKKLILHWFLLLVVPSLHASKEVEVEIGHSSISHDHLLLQTGDRIVFKNVVDMDGGHSVAISSDTVTKVASPALDKGEQWIYEFKEPGSYVYYLQEHPGVRGKATVFADDRMKVAVTDLRKEMVSYSIGFDFGEQVVKKLDNLDLRLFVAGLQHAYNDEDPKLDEDEMEFIIADYKREIVRLAQLKFDKMAASNQKESTAFLTSNKKNKDVIVLDSGLQYKILKKGNGKHAMLGDKVKVQYLGTFINGVEFDNTSKTGVAEFAITAQVLPGLVEAMLLMSEGSKWQLFVPPQLAYGIKGQRNFESKKMSIEPNATLLFDIELIEVLGGNVIRGGLQAGNQ